MIRFVFVAVLLACSSLAADHVILITIDGFPARMVQDKRTHIPRIRALAEEGAVADAMKVSNPSVTWPNHTTLVSGVRPRKHSVLFNGILVRGDDSVKIDPDVTSAQLVKAPTVFDLLHGAGLKTAGVNWPCTRSSKSLDDDFPDSPNMLNFTTPKLRTELVAAGILPSEDQADFAKIGEPTRDEIWTKTACFLIHKRMPAFMAVHLLNTDSTHHKYGPETMASFTALALADRFVGDIVDAVNASGHKNNTTIIVTADHGFATATNVIQPNVLFHQAGLLEVTSAGRVTNGRVQCVPEGGSGFIYCNEPATREEDRRKAIQLLTGKEGVLEVVGPEKFEELGIPPAGEGGSPDLLLKPKIGYGVVGAANDDNFVAPVTPKMSSGYHGYIDEPLMNAAFVISGNHIKKGVKLGTIENVDVAPTIMRLLGKDLPNGDGKVLEDVLSGVKRK